MGNDPYATTAHIVAEITNDCVRQRRGAILSLIAQGENLLQAGSGVSIKDARAYTFICLATLWMRKISSLLQKETVCSVVSQKEAEQHNGWLEDTFGYRIDVWVRGFSFAPHEMVRDKKQLERIARDVVPFFFTPEQAAGMHAEYAAAVRSFLLLEMLKIISNN